MTGIPLGNFRARFDRGHSDDDLAAEFIEQEVGHYDWANNWPVFKARFPDQQSLLEHVRAWLDRMEIDHDPQSVVNYLNAMVTERPGKWR